MAVEQAAAMSREEERLRKSFDSICTLLSTNNTALFISECSQFDQYVVPFLEKPHLLNRILGNSVTILIEYAKSGLLSPSNTDKTKVDAVFSVLYSIIRVRGRKSAVAYFPNDVFLLSPCIHFLKSYDENDLSLWKSQFVLLFWVSLLLLSPFDLSTIQEADEDLAADLYNLSILYMNRTDCVGEMASEMLSLFLSRRDISHIYLQPTLELLLSQLETNESPLYCNLLCLSSFLKHVHEEEMRDIIEQVELQFLPKCELLMDSSEVHYKTRILLLKIVSQLCIHRMKCVYNDHGVVIANQSIKNIQSELDIPEEVLERLSNCISLLLSQLQENSILLREKVSTYISKIAVYLPTDFCQTIINEIRSLMEEDYAVEVLHGCCYAIAALLANRCIPAESIPTIISITRPYIVYQLEKKTASTSAMVRDGACYILWSLVRNYPPVLYVDEVPAIIPSLVRLCISDKEINTRRAAAAVIQEIVGRVGVDQIHEGIDLINILNYQSLAQLQNIYSVVIPQLVKITPVQKVICEHILWTVHHQENISITEHLSQSVFYVAQHIPSLLESLVIQPLVSSDWTALSHRVLSGALVTIASSLRGFHIQQYLLSPSLLSRLQAQFQLILTQSFPIKQSMLIRVYKLALLQALSYTIGVEMEWFVALFPLPVHSISRPTRQLEFTQEEQTLLVCSRWFFEHHHQQGIEYCSDLGRESLTSLTEYSVHLFGAIYWEITLPFLDQAIALLSTKQDPAVLEALSVVISRLLRVQPVNAKWKARCVSWFSACCNCYLRDIRGDVGSWTRIAGILGMEELLDKMVFFLPTEWEGESGCEVKGLNEYFVTKWGIAKRLDNSFMEFLPLSEGSSLFPCCVVPTSFIGLGSIGSTNGSSSVAVTSSPVAPSPDTPVTPSPPITPSLVNHSPIDETTTEAICRIILKQLAEQHSIIRTHSHRILTFLLQLQTYQNPFMQHVQSYPTFNNGSVIDQLIYYLKFEDIADVVLQGLIFLIGGNTPVITEEATTHFITYLETNQNKRIVLSLLKILENEYRKATNGFYPSLKTFLICCESIDIVEVFNEKEMKELRQLLSQASIRYKKKVAVLKLLLELLQVVSNTIPTTNELVTHFIPFLSCQFSYIREEASQILFMSLTMKETPGTLDEELLQIIGGGAFGGDDYQHSVNEIQTLLQ